MAFSPHDPHTLLYGTQFMMTSADRGQTWMEISPDLTAVPGEQPAPAESRTRPPAAITTFSASAVNAGVIWAATGNGQIQLTEDGGRTWTRVTPPGLPAGGAFEIIEAGRHDAATAYAALIVPQNMHAYLYRTHDAGRTWQPIGEGLPDTAFARVVREDPVRRGLLFCGTERGVYLSFDDGDRWQSLQLNLPSSSMRDLVVHGNDLVLVTYGRGIWILDDITPLREAGRTGSDLGLLRPAVAVRARWGVNSDTPLPVETPTPPDPPPGAGGRYLLPSGPAGEPPPTITAPRGRAVRSSSSVAPPPPALLANVPSYWFAPPPILTKNRGHNRFAWNLRYPPPRVLPFGYFGGLLQFVEYTLADHAIPGATPREQPEGPLVLPGEYTIELSGGGRRDRKTLVVRPDPRVKASAAELAAQFDLTERVLDMLAVTYSGWTSLRDLRATIPDPTKALAGAGEAAEAREGIEGFDKKIDAIQNGSSAAPGVGIVNRDAARLYEMLVSGDAQPAQPLVAAIGESCQALATALESWRRVAADDWPAIDATLTRMKLSPLGDAAAPATPRCEP